LGSRANQPRPRVRCRLNVSCCAPVLSIAMTFSRSLVEPTGTFQTRMDGCTKEQTQAAQAASHNPSPINTPPRSIGSPSNDPPTLSNTKTHHEPLAWSLNPSNVVTQSNCPLFTLLPLEIREIIYTYALRNTSSYPIDHRDPAQPNLLVHWKHSGYRITGCGSISYRSNIAVSLLSTCKAVYLETWDLSFKINKYIMHGFNTRTRKRKRTLAAWQIARIEGLDIMLTQYELENGILRDALQDWEGGAGRRGTCVVPMGCLGEGGRGKLEGYSKSFNDYRLIPASDSFEKSHRRLAEILERLSIPQEDILPSARSLRVALARPLTHLTLRITSRAWMNSDDPPLTDHTRKRYRDITDLCLDPTFGKYPEGQCSPEVMRFLASERLTGRHPNLDPRCWGRQIMSLLPDLTELVLVLEAHKVKEDQLECIVQCAKTWRFDVNEKGENNEKWALAWDGDIVERRWSRDWNGEREIMEWHDWIHRCNDFEMAFVRYVKKRVEG